jgi:hypothetical protein
MRKIQRHTQAKMFGHIEVCKESKQPQKVYCKQHSIAYSTFQYWAKKYCKEFKANTGTDSSPGFIPVKVQPGPEPEQVCLTNQLMRKSTIVSRASAFFLSTSAGGCDPLVS